MKIKTTNMSKQWRMEIAELRRQRRVTKKLWGADNKKLSSQARQIKAEISANNRLGAKCCRKLDRRIAILEGRLS